MPRPRWEAKRTAPRAYKSEKPVLVRALVVRAQPASTNAMSVNS